MPSVSVTNTATQIVSTNPRRHSIVIQNLSSSVVYIGVDSNVTASGDSVNDGIAILQNGSFSFDAGGLPVWKGPIYGITASGTSDVRYWERNQQ
jgi:hypothetical protein